ncbi:MAG: hypothetical protein PHV74_05395 [Dehalococcoidia bacterium]|nr:hypothetical protein [Dehalococcoidia bacterium]
MEKDRIKSAREIAMERVAKMSSLSPEQVKQQKEREYGPRGEAIARKYLQGAVRGTDLQAELDRYPSQEAQIVRRSLVSTLCESINLDDMDRNVKALEGIRTILKIQNDFKTTERELGTIAVQFAQDARQEYEMCEKMGIERLKNLGISGSAAKPNVKGTDDWRHRDERIRQDYAPKVDQVKKTIAIYVESRLANEGE